VKRQDQQAAAGVIVGDGAWLDRLQGELRGALAPVFAQARSRLTAFAYIGARGDKTVGVTRQHAGITGQVENCQTTVFAAYVTGRGRADPRPADRPRAGLEPGVSVAGKMRRFLPVPELFPADLCVPLTGRPLRLGNPGASG
jgi:hypothetical protein